MAVTAAKASQLEMSLSASGVRLHGYAASIADSRVRLAATNDQRFVQSINSVIPLYNAELANYNAIARELGAREIPAKALIALQGFSDSVTDTASKLTEGSVNAVLGALEGAGETAKALPGILTGLLWVAGVGLVVYGLTQVRPIVQAVKSI